MSNAIQLQTPAGEVVDAALCRSCRRIWESMESANRCCTCSRCGLPCSWAGPTTHPECDKAASIQRDQDDLAAAELVEDYDGPFLLGERFFWDRQELTESGKSIPEFMFCLNPVSVSASIDDILGALEGEHCETILDSLEGTDALTEAINRFNADNADNTTWYEDRKRKARTAL